MKLSFLTLYDQALRQFFDRGVVHRAIELGIIELDVIQWRNFSKKPHFKVDSPPFSKRTGMVLRYDVLAEALRCASSNAVFVMPDPKGERFNYRHAAEMSKMPHVYFISPAFEGVDERVFKSFDIRLFSMGDFIVMNGDSSAVVMAEAIVRNVSGVVGNFDSTHDESILSGLLESPHYTHPRSIDQMDVPDVLLSGHHQEIDRWKKKQSIRRTLYARPDLLNSFSVDKAMVKEIDTILLEDGS
jgi:tRNA (guanine37-N1)-methyltransferase